MAAPLPLTPAPWGFPGLYNAAYNFPRRSKTILSHPPAGKQADHTQSVGRNIEQLELLYLAGGV